MSAVYKAIAAVQGELAKTGIAKSRRNKQGEGYMFRGIDDVYAALNSRHGGREAHMPLRTFRNAPA